MYEAEFKGLPRVQSELRHRHAGAGGVSFQTEWNNLELLKRSRASNSRKPNEYAACAPHKFACQGGRQTAGSACLAAGRAKTWVIRSRFVQFV